MAEREDPALELARKICKLIDSHTEWSSPDTKIAALLRPHVWQWVPVGERLPGESKHLYPYKADILMRRGDDWRSGTYQRKQFVSVDGWVQTGITHWAALPSAPLSNESSDQK